MKEDGGKKGQGLRRYKKVHREGTDDTHGSKVCAQVSGQKRGTIDDQEEAAEVKRGKMVVEVLGADGVDGSDGRATNINSLAGLQEQPRRDQ